MPFAEAPDLHSSHPSGILSHEWLYWNNRFADCTMKIVPAHPLRPNSGEGMSGFLLALSQNWKTLSTATQQTWRNYARRFNLTLYLAYQKYNMIRYMHDLEAVDEPPAYS